MQANLSYKIIDYRSEYKDLIIRLITQSLKDQGAIPKSVDLIDDPDLFKIPEIYSGSSKFWVAIIGNDVVGTAAIREMDESTAKLKRMFVETKYHGTGIGQALLNKALDYARSQGFKKIILGTHPSMKRAHRFYEKNHFVKEKEDENEYYFSYQFN